jgi:hypothetical protein
MCQARFKAEFIARIDIVAEEADEAALWLERLTASGIISQDKIGELRKFPITHLPNGSISQCLT